MCRSVACSFSARSLVGAPAAATLAAVAVATEEAANAETGGDECSMMGFTFVLVTGSSFESQGNRGLKK